MNCQALITDFLCDYHAGELPLARRLEFELHLKLCPDCRTYVDAYKKTITLAKDATCPPAPPNPPQDLINAILKVTGNEKCA